MRQEIFITEELAGDRIDKFLSEQCEELSRSFIQKLLKSGEVFVGQKPVKASYKVSEGDVITFEVPEAVEPEIVAEDIPLDIVYEDHDVILVNKPKGMVVHPAAGHYSGTLVNALMFHCKDDLSGINGVLRPGIVHRIDMDTTGVLIACKNDLAHNSIAEQLKEHSITRRYQAIVHGVLKQDEGTVDAPIGRHPQDRKKMCINHQNGKHAVTHYKVLKENDVFTDAIINSFKVGAIKKWSKELSNRIIDDSIDSIRSYVKLHEKENMDALDEVMWNSIADIKFNVMKDTLTKK